MNVDAKPKDKAMVSLVETKPLSHLTRLRGDELQTHFRVVPPVGELLIVL